MAVSDEFVRQVSEALVQLGAASLENQSGQPRGAAVVTDLETIKNVLSMPGVQYDDNPVTNPNAIAQAYIQIPYSVLSDALSYMQEATESVFDVVTGAENVNAQLSGMTVTITDRNGQSSSVDIGFEISPEHVYVSKAAMIADAANVPAGKFCMIATSDATTADNATLWLRNGNPASDPSNAFTFLSDLDQASSSAWADWLENMKPQIESAIATADSDHLRSNADHMTAVSDHSSAADDHATAVTDHTTADADHIASATATASANTQAARAKKWADHPPFIGDGLTGDEDYWYIYDEELDTYVRSERSKGDDLDYSTMTEEEKQILIDNVTRNLVMASPSTCRSIIGELE